MEFGSYMEKQVINADDQKQSESRFLIRNQSSEMIIRKHLKALKEKSSTFYSIRSKKYISKMKAK